MGTAGDVGRFAFNAVMPDQLLIGMAGGWATRGAMAYESARAVKLAKDASRLAQLEAVAGVSASQAARSASGKAIAGGIGLGAAENAAYEKLRQSVNFEDESSGVLAAGLMGAAITSPFAIKGSRSAITAARTADQELQTLRALRAVEQGHKLTPEQGQRLAELHKAHKVVAELEAGRLSPEDAEAALTEFHGPHEPADRWLERYGERLTRETEDFISQHYPSRNGKETGRAAPSPAARARMDDAVDMETLTNFPDQAPGTNPPLEGAMRSAFKTALAERGKRRKAADLRALDESQAAALKAEREAQWTQAQAGIEAQKKADMERMVNMQQLLLAEHDPLAPAPVKAPPTEPAAPHPAEAQVGKEVSWMGPEGETIEGKVTSWNPAIGKLIVKTSEGMKAVHPDSLDVPMGHAPEHFTSDVGSSVGAMQVRGTQLNSTASGDSFGKTLKFVKGGREFDTKIPTRFDYFAILNSSPLKTVRELAYKLIKDPLQNDLAEAQAMTASEWKSQLRRIVAGEFHVQAGQALAGAMKDMQIPFWKKEAFAVDFHRWVTESTYDPKMLSTLPTEVQAHVQKASSAMKAVYAKMLKEMQDAGVKGADQITPDEFYTNRIWHAGNIRRMAELHGDDALFELLASAIKDKPGVLERMRKSPGTNEVRDTLTNTVTHAGKTDAELLKLKATRFLKAIKALEFSPALRDVALAGRDMGTLRGELKSLGVAESHIDDLVDLMFEVRPQDADAGRAANLKFRFQLDQSAEVKTPKGTLRLSDLFETDARVLVDTYVNSVGGHVGLAKHGITSQADWMKALKQVEEEASVSLKADETRIKADMQRLQDIHNNIVGRPMSEAAFSAANRTAAAVRGYTRSVMLPQLGIAAAFEFGKSVAMFGFTTMLRQLPTLHGFIRALRQGFIPDKGLAQDIRLMTGFGNEMHASYIRAQEIEDGFFGQALTRMEHGANRLSHISDVLSGNASFTSLTKQWGARMAVQQFSNHAHGKKLTKKLQERWVGQGIGEDDLPDVMAAFKEHAELDDKGTVTGIRYEDWQAKDQKSYDTFQTFLSRQVREAVQDHDLGESMPFMHGPLGKLFGELKTFFLVGHAKNFLKNAVFHDATALQVWTIGFLAEALAYSTQTAINYPTELDTKLTPEKIATSAFFRMASMGTLSMLTESLYSVGSGGNSFVSPGMTTNTDNRSMWRSPSMIVVGRLMNAPATLAGMTLGTDVTTSREARDLLGAVPLARLYGLQALGNYWANGFPATDPTKAPAH